MFTVPGYETTEVVYEGERSMIYRALGEEDRRATVLKVLKTVHPSLKSVARFKREYQLTRDLAIPGVIEVHEQVQAQGYWVIVEEDFGGESLSRLALAGRIELSQFIQLAITVTRTLGAIHQRGVIHKDINPSNILLNPGTQTVKIIDFGISARALAEERVSFDHPSRIEGTPGYMSPEQTGRVNRPLDYRTDFYSLGCTFYQLLTGEIPFATDDLLELVHSHVARAPTPPHELDPEIPRLLSALVLKLMAKNPADRYQSAHGLEVDLCGCLQGGSAEASALGASDVDPHLRQPTRLYGREREVDELLRAFDEASQGGTRFVLVTGASGLGKSSLIKELYVPITERKGFFVSGKFDQYKRNIPYAPVLDAFRALVQQVLCEGDREIEVWRDLILEVVGPSCVVIGELIPQLELIMGPLPPPVSLSTGDSRRRFMRAMREFTRAFARAEHPLVLFLDDLQWADGPSLEFVKGVMTMSHAPHLLVIGAYRDNEVEAGHPLSLALKDIGLTEYLHLEALSPGDVSDMVADMLATSASLAAPLAHLVFDKTRGNPFFIGQFLQSLQTKDLLQFDLERGAWDWDMGVLGAQEISANVVDLLVEALARLPTETRSLLNWAAYIGNHFDLRTLMAVGERSARQVTTDLLPALTQGFVLPLTANYRLFEVEIEGLEEQFELTYKFAHDRIQQALYTSVLGEDEESMHLHIGRCLQRVHPEQLLEITNHLNSARVLMNDQQSRRDLARLNLGAGRRAKSSGAGEAALGFLNTGLSMLATAVGQEEATSTDKDGHDLGQALITEAADAAFLSAEFEIADSLTSEGIERAQDWGDKVKLYEVKIEALSARKRFSEALDAAREILRPLGVDLPVAPGTQNVAASMEEVDRALDGRSAETLMALEAMEPTNTNASVLRILNRIFAISFLTAPALAPIIVANMVLVSIRHGRTEDSTDAFTYYGMILCGRDRIPLGYQFGCLARTMARQEHHARQMASVIAVGGSYVFHWKEPLRTIIDDMRDAYKISFDAGAIASATNCLKGTVTMGFTAGLPLTGLESSAIEISSILERAKQGPYLDMLRIFRQGIHSLQGRSDDPLVLKGEVFDEEVALLDHQKSKNLGLIYIIYYVKMSLFYRFGAYAEALACYTEHLHKGNQPGAVLVPAVTMLHSLALLANWPEGSDEREGVVRQVRDNQERMQRWAEYAPMNYSHKYHLVEAELARAQNRDGEVQAHYDEAIDLAHTHGFLNEESLALERAGEFFRERGRHRLARYYLGDAYYAYQRWGASAKLRELKQRYPVLLAPVGSSALPPELVSRAGTLETGELPDLDLETVLRALRALGEEHELSGLLERVMRTCLEYAGASEGFLILVRGDELLVKARGAVDEDNKITTALLSVALADQEGLSHALVHYVAKSWERRVLDDAAREGPFVSDPHVRAKGSRSIACLPILYQGTLLGIAYMANDQTGGAFDVERMEVLNLLMTQAAVSMDNVLLRRVGEGIDFQFTVGGSLAADTPSYIMRQADHQLIRRVEQGEFCYVFDARQMGKSSLRVHTIEHLQREGVRCVGVDLTAIGSETVSMEQWYAGIARAMVSGLGLGEELELRRWWRARDLLSPVQRLAELVDEIVLERVDEPLALFIDEFDAVFGLGFSPHDFIALLRSLHNRRADEPRYRKLAIILLGVVSPAALTRDSERTPLNIGHAVSLAGFHYQEAKTLLRGLVDFDNPERVLQAILSWTAGQPFLTQKLCQLAQQAESRPRADDERGWVARLVKERVADSWEMRDEPQHLRTIEARILHSPNRSELLAVYQEILERGFVSSDPRPIESELLLSGLVVRESARLSVNNLIYASIFDEQWVARVGGRGPA